MDDDIVTRLQFHAKKIINGQEIEVIPGTYLLEAADEIEWLRETVEHWKGNANALTDWVVDLKKQLGHFDEDED
jgi:hypothetical protein